MVNKDTLLIDTLSEHIQANAEYVERLTFILINAFPYLHEDIYELFVEWKRINSEINKEYEEKLNE